MVINICIYKCMPGSCLKVVLLCTSFSVNNRYVSSLISLSLLVEKGVLRLQFLCKWSFLYFKVILNSISASPPLPLCSHSCLWLVGPIQKVYTTQTLSCFLAVSMSVCAAVETAGLPWPISHYWCSAPVSTCKWLPSLGGKVSQLHCSYTGLEHRVSK